MAEERTLGLARASQRFGEDESKENLQRRMELARDSISNTVTEIKESVAHQYQAVKDTLDWREQFKKRPVAWSAGALGVGLVTGYSIAGAFKDDDRKSTDYGTRYGYPTQRPAANMSASPASFTPPDVKDEGPGLVERFKETPAYDVLSKEVSSLGSKVVEELSSTAKLVVIPFLLSKLKEMVGIDRLEKSMPRPVGSSTTPRTDWTEPDRTSKRESTLGHS
jgi:hypothetical protein